MCHSIWSFGRCVNSREDLWNLLYKVIWCFSAHNTWWSGGGDQTQRGGIICNLICDDDICRVSNRAFICYIFLSLINNPWERSAWLHCYHSLHHDLKLCQDWFDSPELVWHIFDVPSRLIDWLIFNVFWVMCWPSWPPLHPLKARIAMSHDTRTF